MYWTRLIIFLVVLFSAAMAYCVANGLTSRNTKIVIQNTQAYLVTVGTVTVTAAGTTGQCIGILCGVTHAD